MHLEQGIERQTDVSNSHRMSQNANIKPGSWSEFMTDPEPSSSVGGRWYPFVVPFCGRTGDIISPPACEFFPAGRFSTRLTNSPQHARSSVPMASKCSRNARGALRQTARCLHTVDLTYRLPNTRSNAVFCVMLAPAGDCEISRSIEWKPSESSETV